MFQPISKDLSESFQIMMALPGVAAWHCACNQLSCHIHASREALQDERRRFAFREALQAGQEEIERRFTKKHTVSHFFWLRYRHCAQAKFGSKGERGSQQ